MNSSYEELIYDWNQIGEFQPEIETVEVDDETLRDGLQSPSVREPSLAEKIAILNAMVSIGIRRGDIGLPMSSQLEDIRGLIRHIIDNKLDFSPGLAVRTVISDLQHIADLQQEFGIPIKAEAFLGCSRIRQMVEGWDVDFLLKKTEEAIVFAKEHEMPIMFVTEDTTRAHPDDLARIYGVAVDAGADEICIADTVGHSTPWGVRAVVGAVCAILEEHGRSDVLVNWHGHSDRGLAVINSIVAASAGADVIHAAGVGIGERSGNTPMDQLLVNLKLMGLWEHSLTGLPKYVECVADAVNISVPPNYPVFGKDAFRTATGVHAAAIVKATKSGDSELADVIYSGVPAHLFGLKQRIEIGRMSGKSNVIFWLANEGIAEDPALVECILSVAHESRKVLSQEDLLQVVDEWKDSR